MNTTFPRILLRLLPLLVLCLCCACQAVKSSSSSVAPPRATTESERLGDSLLETGRTEQAVAEYDRALAAGADEASIAYRKGFAYFNEGQWKKALELFQDAVRIDPKMAIAYEGAGIASFQLGYFDQASDYFIGVMERAPAHWVSYAFMAGVLAAQKNLRGSREMHRKALEVAGKNQFRQVNALLAETYKRGEYLVRTGMYQPGKTAPGAAAQKHGQTAPEAQAQAETTNVAASSADAAAGNVYRSVKTLSAEEKEKIRQQMLARLDKAGHPPAKTESTPEQPASAPLQPKEPKEPVAAAEAAGATGTALEITPLDDAEVQALLRAHKTGQIKERLAKADAAPGAKEATETLEKAADAAQEPAVLPAATEQPETGLTESNGPDSFVTNGQQLVTSPVIDPEPQAGSSAGSAFLRDLPTTGYSAMESSFPYLKMADERAGELQAKGLEPYITPVDLGGRGTWYRVLFGPFATRKEAKAMRNRLAKQYGLTEAIVIKHTQD